LREGLVVAATILVLAVIAAAGAALYRYALQNMSEPLRELQPRECAGYTYPMDPDGVAIVYSIRTQAYRDGFKLEEVYLKELDVIAQFNCTGGYALLANKTWTPGGGESPWRQFIYVISANPAIFPYMLPESLVDSLPNRTVAPGIYAAWQSRYGAAGGATVNVTFALFNATVRYTVSELDAYDPVTGVLTMRRLVYTAVPGQELPPFAPDTLVRDMVVDSVYVQTGPALFHDVKRVVDSLILLGLGAGALVAAGLIGVVNALAGRGE